MIKNRKNSKKSMIVAGFLMLVILSSVASAVTINHDGGEQAFLYPVPHPIYGTAVYQGGGNADGATVQVVSILGVLNTVVASGAWQVDCGDPGPNWLAGTAFIVWVNGTGSYVGWQGTASGTVSGYYNNMGEIVLRPTSINNPPNKPHDPIPAHDEWVVSPVALSVVVDDPDDDTLAVSFFVDGEIVYTQSEAESGSRVTTPNQAFDPNSSHDWYVVVDDGEFSNQSDKWQFHITDQPETSLAFLAGLIINKTEYDSYITFEALLLFNLPLFSSFQYEILSNNEKILIQKPYFGFVGEKVIFVLAKEAFL